MEIMILTKNYPDPNESQSQGTTTVIRDFARVWQDMGNDVRVYHIHSVAPSVVRFFPKALIRLINSKFGYSLSFHQKRSKSLKNRGYLDQGVEVISLPFRAFLPKVPASRSLVKRLFKQIQSDALKNSFVPDVVVAHWEDPQIELMGLLGREHDAATVFTCHKITYLSRKKYYQRNKKALDDADLILARSEAIANELQSILGSELPPKVCRSGIEDGFFTIPWSPSGERNGVTYVGRLITYKRVDSVIDGFEAYWQNISADRRAANLDHLQIVGDGTELGRLRSLADGTLFPERIRFLGRKSRMEVADILRRSSIFVMISERETFGLAYLEAMACGCIVIASIDGGMAGIIEHGVNGFFCHPGDSRELAELFSTIDGLTSEQIGAIRANARVTAEQFSMSEQGYAYLQQLKEAVRHHQNVPMDEADKPDHAICSTRETHCYE